MIQELVIVLNKVLNDIIKSSFGRCIQIILVRMQVKINSYLKTYCSRMKVEVQWSKLARV